MLRAARRQSTQSKEETSFDITRDHGPSHTKQDVYIPNIVHGSVLLPRKDPLRPVNPNDSTYIKGLETTQNRHSTDGVR